MNDGYYRVPTEPGVTTLEEPTAYLEFRDGRLHQLFKITTYRRGAREKVDRQWRPVPEAKS